MCRKVLTLHTRVFSAVLKSLLLHPLSSPRAGISFRTMHWSYKKSSDDENDISLCYTRARLFKASINKQKNADSQQNLAVFLAGKDSENKIIRILHKKRTKTNLDKLVIIRTGTYL